MLFNHYYYIIILFAVLYAILSKRQTPILLSIIIIIILYYYYNTYRAENEAQFKADSSKKEDKIRHEVKDVVEISTDNFYIHKSNKDIKYLVKNKEFMDILFNIRFIKRFDKTRYSNMIVNLDKLMKIYMYILADRYDVNTYLPIFTDIKNNVLEIFYSLIFVVPNQFKHIYGFDPQTEIDKSLSDFRSKTKQMLTVITNYARIGQKKVYVNNDKYMPYEKNKELVLP
jgi:transcriptional regulator with PAS, ATPase and Fis domain